MSGISKGSAMRVIIEQTNTLRRELALLGAMVLFGIVTVVVLLVPGLFG